MIQPVKPYRCPDCKGKGFVPSEPGGGNFEFSGCCRCGGQGQMYNSLYRPGSGVVWLTDDELRAATHAEIAKLPDAELLPTRRIE